MQQRYLDATIVNDAWAKGKMAFLSGPRQCGKTTIAKRILALRGQAQNYFSWDDEDFRRVWSTSPARLLQQLAPPPNAGRTAVVFDEVHKDARWKSRLKGLYDVHGGGFDILVTGSARLDFYRKSGDSMLGRYFPYRLHPFSMAETAQIKAPPRTRWLENLTHSFPLNDLMSLGGFPEPLLGGNAQEAARWRRLRRERLVREDLRDLRAVRDLQSVENLTLLLEAKAGGTLSFKSLCEDLSHAHATIADWVSLLESVYFCFLLRPYTKKITRSLKKEPKIYLFDYAPIKDPGHRLENLVAAHLLKSVHAWTDCAFGNFDLHYVADKGQREVDFLISRDGAPYALIEVKTTDPTPTPALLRFYNALKPEFCFQLVFDARRKRHSGHAGIEVLSVEEFLSALN